MADTLKVGFVGCGGISRGHASCFRANEETAIVAACDTRPDAVEKFAKEFAVERTYAGYRDMLAAEELDVVCICTWPNSHAEITIAAARAGVKGVLCEKPMCIDLAEADTMILASKRSGTKLVIGHVRRFIAGHVEARRLIAAGAIGKPSLMRSNGGGGLSNTHTHSIDAFRFLLGDPAPVWVMGQVQRQSDRWERLSPIEDLCLCYVCFDGGARAIIESDMPKSAAPENSFIYGTEGILDIQRASVRLLSAKSTEWQEFKLESTNHVRAQIEEFLALLRGDVEAHRGDAAHARTAMEIMMAVYESARTRSLVHMPLDIYGSPLEQMIQDGTLPVTKPGRYDIRDAWWFDEMKMADKAPKSEG